MADRDELERRAAEVLHPRLRDAWYRIFSDLYVEADEAATKVLDAVEPLIRADALREAAKAVGRNTPDTCKSPGCHQSDVLILEHRAAAEEAGR